MRMSTIIRVFGGNKWMLDREGHYDTLDEYVYTCRGYKLLIRYYTRPKQWLIVYSLFHGDSLIGTYSPKTKKILVRKMRELGLPDFWEMGIF